MRHCRTMGLILLLCPAIACVLSNPGFDDSPSSSSASETSATTGVTAAGTESDDSGASGSASNSASSTNSAGGSGTTGVTDTSSTTEGDTSSTGAPGEAQNYGHYAPGGCAMDHPRWCYNPITNIGIGARIWGQECFPGLQGAFRIEAINYRVAVEMSNPHSPRIEIYSYSGGGPSGKPLVTVPLTSDDVKPGEYEYDVSMMDIQVSAPFCVGIVGGSSMLENWSALGVAVDGIEPAIGLSFMKSDGPMGCNVPEFQDIVDLNPESQGHWCIGFDAIQID